MTQNVISEFCALSMSSRKELDLFVSFYKQSTQFQPRLVELRFRRADGDAKHAGNFLVLETLDVMQYEHILVAGGKLGDRLFKGDPVYDGHFVWVRSALD